MLLCFAVTAFASDDDEFVTTESVGYTEGVYCNDCATFISGHEEIPMIVVAFTNSDKARVESDNMILAVAVLTADELLSHVNADATPVCHHYNLQYYDKCAKMNAFPSVINESE